MAAGEEALAVLHSMDATLKSLLVAILPIVAYVRSMQPKQVAPDRDLDGKYGDPVVKFMPRDWTGPSFVGQCFSECPPELLDMMAEVAEYFATQDEISGKTTANGKPTADFKRADAARARGWAKRMREGRHRPSLARSGMDGNGWEGVNDGFS